MIELFSGLDAWVLVSLLLALTFVLAFEFINGFHDTANAVATVIYTKAMPPHLAVFFSGVFNFLGVLLGGVGVAYAIVHLLPVELLINVNTGHGLAMVISLQALLSYFWDDPRFYNLGSYVLTAPLLLVWILVTVHTRATRERAWLAIASITLISLLPVYHRQYDARMLLLTIPGCVVLCTQLPHFGGMTKLVTAGAILFTGDLLWAILLALLSMAPQPATPRAQWFHAAVEMLPAPLVLLLAAIFFLWAYWRFAAVQDADAQLPA